MSEPESNELVNRYLAGQSDAATAIFERYLERLLALARSRISPRLKRRVDPEDVVQSAFRSFFVHAKNQEYQLARSGDLWRLLASTTLNKLYGQIEKQTAAKRNILREADDETLLAQLAVREPTIAEVVAVGEQLRLILDGLSPDERLVITATLQGQSIDEIGKSIGKSARTVRRLLAQARQQFEERLLRHEVPTGPKTGIRSSQVVEPLAPLRFSDYVLEQLLGAGGMGKVYRATDKRSGKTVAVKALHKSRQGDDRAVARFVQESQILAKLQHPNIVGVEGLGRFPSGGFFIVMDFVAGTDLQTRLASRPLPLAEAMAIVKDVANAVQHAHEQGIVHCDLKPGNVLVDHHQHVFVTDFGFAFMLADPGHLKSQSVGGTAGYLPPEVIRSASQPTVAADIFALGVLLWTLVTGRQPSGPDSLRSDDTRLSRIEPICRRCLAENPRDRYSSASDFSAALAELA
jgi:RNA polymerase sigma factor (sigma-70 family)